MKTPESSTEERKPNNSRYPDPLDICPINPLDFRWENGKSIYDPGWWKDLTPPQKTARKKGARR